MWLTVKDVSKIIKASKSTIYQWAELGQILCFKVNGLLRFEEQEILDWLKSCKLPAPRYNHPVQVEALKIKELG